MNKLATAARDGRLILFIGGGVSMNLGLPEWRKLVQHLAEELGFDGEGLNGWSDYLGMAECYECEKGSLEPVIGWMDENWHSSQIDVGSSEIHRLIIELAPRLIYTTNYDRWLERAFEHYGRKYTKIVNVADLTHIRDDVTQIVKFHGDFDDPSSIVLTESSYFQRLDFESPLDIKLRSDTLSRIILFIGYSLSDINIRYLLYKLQRLWEDSGCREPRPDSYIFLTRRDPVQEKILRKRGIVTLISQHDNPGEGLRRFLAALVEEVAGKQ